MMGKANTARIAASFLLALLLAFQTYTYVLANYNHIADDSFITFRYAQNLGLGIGLVFNAGERYFGSTAMGIAILYAALSYVVDSFARLLPVSSVWPPTSQIPPIAIWTSAISIAAISWTVYRAVCHYIWPIAAAILAAAFTLYLFSAGFMNYVPGHETYPFVSLLCIGAYLLFFRERHFVAGLVLGLATTFRPDTMLFFFVCTVVLAVRWCPEPSLWETEGRQRLTSFILGYVIVVIPWFVFCSLYFGRPLPGTLTAKRAQVLLGPFGAFTITTAIDEMLGRMRAYILAAMGSLVFGSLALVSVRGWAKKQSPLTEPCFAFTCSLLVFGVGELLFYALIKVSYWSWYIFPFCIILAVTAVLSVALLLSTALSEQRLAARGGAAIVIAAGAILIAQESNHLYRRTTQWWTTENINQHTSSYDPIIAYLKDNEPAGTSVATAEPGALGYKLGPRFTIVDILGLITPGVADHIIAGDLDFPFTKYRPKYVIISWRGKYEPHDRPWFPKVYKLVGEFHHPYWQEALKRGVYLYSMRIDGESSSP